MIAQMYIIMSEYDVALQFYSKTTQRCPDTSMTELAEFEIAYCLEHLNRPREAIKAYEDFAEKYKSSPRTRIAIRASQVIQAS